MGSGANGTTYVCENSSHEEFILKEISLANKSDKEINSMLNEV